MKKSALIWGVTGQDGSYLAEFLLEKGYDVHGVIRRASTFNTGRIDHILDEPNFHFHHGDVTDANNVNALISKIKPDEIYNLSAQSHVRVSFDLPHYTAEVDALGTLNILEAIRQHSPKTKIYQASTSELYGGMTYNRPETGYTEESPMHPRSPYGCAKIYAYWIMKNYRESYNMFACNGILFNHECISENSPIIIRNKKTNNVDITTIKNYRTYKKKGANKQQWLSFDDEMWDGEKFVDIKCITATKIDKNNEDHKILIQNTRNGSVETTAHHNLLNSDNEKVKSRDVSIGDSLKCGIYPTLNSDKSLTKEEAMFLGLMVGDGYVSKDGDSASFTNNNSVYLDLMKELWCKISNGYVSDVKENKTEYGYNKSISLLGDSLYLKRLRNEIYTKDSLKKIPLSILNTDRDNKIEFLKGYNISDGLKSNPCVYEFKNFKSNSSVLAQGLLTLVNNVLNQKYNLTVETKVDDDKTRTYYSINLLTDKQDRTEEINEMLSKGISQRKISESLNVSRSTISKIVKGEEVYKDSHLLKDDRESVKKKIENEKHVYEYVYDIEVDTGRIMSGVGNVVIANSPRRGETFVTRKITIGLSQIFNGKKNTPLSMGNLDSLRDWGHAQDYCINLDVPILTTNGWKYYEDINIGDVIINFDSDKNNITTDIVNKKVLLDTNGEKIKFTGKGVYLNVSPNHRMYYQKKSKKSKGGWSKYKVETAENLYNILNDKSLRSKYDYRLPHFQNYDKCDYEKYSDDELYLIGALLAEGSYSNSYKGRGSSVSISQSYIKNEIIHKKLKEIFQRLGLFFWENNRNDGVTEWVFNSDTSKKIMSYFDTFDVHIMPKDFYNLSSRQANIVLESLMDCDGCWGSYSYKSKRYLLACDFQTIAHLSGYRTSEVYNKQGVYDVYLISKNKKHSYITDVEKWNDGAEKVWCVSTNNETIITRDNETINISGNCRGMYLMLQQDEPDDYVLATNEVHSVREFIEICCDRLGYDLEWHGKGEDEYGIDKKTGKVLININPKYYRPAEVDYLLGDYSKAKKELGWSPETSFKELVTRMLDSDLENYK